MISKKFRNLTIEYHPGGDMTFFVLDGMAQPYLWLSDEERVEIGKFLLSVDDIPFDGEPISTSDTGNAEFDQAIEIPF